ncbi:hypothetical protein BDB01DRAFT_500585 [Pilobolus umbonatus]|nr:hypothetical protein BDB01DRAFT_500585 [Pilobolus umbonatus]
MNDDPIDAYSSHEEGLQEWTDEENILDRLDDWNPHPKYEETIDNDDIYPINSDTDTRDSCSIHSGIAEYKESTTVNRQQDDHDMHMPCFSLDSVRKNTHTQYKENGLADRALKTMLQEFDSYNQWDRRVNAEIRMRMHVY